MCCLPIAKFKRLPFPNSNHISEHAFDLIHCDVWGPFANATHDGFKYFLTIVDDATRSTWVYLMNSKTKTRPLLISFYKMIFTQFQTNIKVIRIDNAHEFFLKDFYAQHGIIHQHSCVATPQQNSIVDRKHKHILNIARALKFQSNRPFCYWGDCFLTAVYIINRLPSTVLDNKTPFEKFYCKIPSYHHLKVFGYLCFASTLAHNRSKFAPRSIPCIFLGYPFGVKGYKLLNLVTRQIFISSDVSFHENVFPFISSVTSPQSSFFFPHICPNVEIPVNTMFLDPIVSSSDLPSSTCNPTPISNQVLDPIPPVISDSAILESVPSDSTVPQSALSDSANINSTEPDSLSFDHSHIIVPHASIPSLRRSSRPSKVPAYLQDYKCSIITLIELSQSTSLNNKSGTSTINPGTKYPISDYIDSSLLSSSYANFCSLSTSIPEPRFYHEVVKDPKWKEAMNAEIAALVSNHTWTLTPLPSNKKAIGCKWVYRMKYKANGSVERYKVKLVAKGFT